MEDEVSGVFCGHEAEGLTGVDQGDDGKDVYST